MQTPRPKGFVTIASITGDDGRRYTADQARRFGWLDERFRPGPPGGWDIPPEEVCLGFNLFTDAGRQMLAYCFGFQAPVADYVISAFGVGTGITAPKVTDLDLQNPVALSTGNTKPIDGVDYPAPFIARVQFTLGANDANGYLLTEAGLYAGNGTLYARRTQTGLNKSSEWSPTLAWRFRF